MSAAQTAHFGAKSPDAHKAHHHRNKAMAVPAAHHPAGAFTKVVFTSHAQTDLSYYSCSLLQSAHYSRTSVDALPVIGHRRFRGKSHHTVSCGDILQFSSYLLCPHNQDVHVAWGHSSLARMKSTNCRWAVAWSAALSGYSPTITARLLPDHSFLVSALPTAPSTRRIGKK